MAKVGRPTKYKPEFAKIADKMCQLGATDAELADALGVTTVTIWRWQSSIPEFCKALRAGKKAADARVERSLYQRAVGYTYDAVKVFMPAGREDPVYAEYREHVPADVGGAKLWLTNRCGDEWREKSEVEHIHKASIEERLAAGRRLMLEVEEEKLH